MRVLLWSELFWPYIGGAERFLVSLATALSSRGCECLVITSHHDRDLPDEDALGGMAIRRLPFRAAVAAGRLGEFAALIERVAGLRRRFRAQLVHLNAVGPSTWFLLKTMRADHAPLLATLQQEVLRSQESSSRSLLDRVLTDAQWIVGCSPTVLQQARALQPAIGDRSSCIYNGIEIAGVAPSPMPASPHVLSIGRLVPAKRVDLAIRAVARLATDIPDVRMTVAGDGSERIALERLARELLIADRVQFTGWVDPARLPAVMNGATVVIMPSAREGLGLVAVEAAMMGRPVVASRAGGLADLIRDGETGLLVDGESPEAWAGALARVVTDPARAARMGACARDRAQSLVNWDNVVAAYEDLYRRLGRGASSVDNV